MNFNFVKNFDLDISTMESFIESLKNPMILDCFTELHQLLNLLSSPNPENYLNPSIKNRLYNRINIYHLIILFEK